MNGFPPARALASALMVAALAFPATARGDDFVDLNCSSATVPMRALLDLKAHLPQPLGRLLDASQAVAHEYERCAASYRSAFQLENMNYALFQKGRQELFTGQLEAKYGDPGRARAALNDAASEMQIIIGYKDRAKDPGPDQNAAGARGILDSRNDNVPSAFEQPAKAILKQAQDLLATLAVPATPSPAPTK
ncbi:MAG: hypothetical protein ABI346_00290 [Candidatus Baltobacteraceae bacterium]